MRNQNRIVRRRRLIAGKGVIDEIKRIGSNGYETLKKEAKRYVKAGAQYGLSALADKGHELIQYAQDTANDKVNQVVGSGMNYGPKNNRSIVLQALKQSLSGSGIRGSRKHRMV